MLFTSLHTTEAGVVRCHPGWASGDTRWEPMWPSRSPASGQVIKLHAWSDVQEQNRE